MQQTMTTGSTIALAPCNALCQILDRWRLHLSLVEFQTVHCWRGYPCQFPLVLLRPAAALQGT